MFPCDSLWMISPLSIEWSAEVPIISPFNSAGFCFMYLGGLFLGEASLWALKRSGGSLGSHPLRWDCRVDSADWWVQSQLGLDAVVSIKWGSRMGCRACTARCLGTWVRQERPRKGLAASFTLQTGLATGCALFSRRCQRGCRWAVWLPTCSGRAHWSGQRLTAVCSTKHSYRLVSLPEHSRSSRLKITNAMSVVSHWPMPQVPWPVRATGFAVRTVSSAHPVLHSGPALVRSFWVFSPGLPVWWGWGPCFPVSGAPAPTWDGLRRPISGTSQVLVNGLSGQEGSEATVCSRKGRGLALVPG